MKKSSRGCILDLIGLVVSFVLIQWEAMETYAHAAASVQMDLVYRYADDMGKVSDWRTMTMEQHDKLMRRDQLRHEARRRGLLAMSLSPSNETADLEILGGLHYAIVVIGTPSKTFLVALDTGSDLLWVPCDCQQCSPTNWANYGFETQALEFAVYGTSSSSTSKNLSCTNSLCSSSVASPSSACSSNTQACEYTIKYMSSDTSTSGFIVEDVLHLNYEAPESGNTTASIYFGCAQLQTGDLLQGVAPNGLFGLGPEDISVPSTLARNGVISTNSFSMCFSSGDSSGRLVFGVEALSGIPSTPLVPINPSVYYVVATTKFSVHGNSVDASENLIFDTGTSYTTLPPSTYQSLGEIMNNQINAPQFQLNGTFDYCWNTSDSSILDSLPTLTITFNGGSSWDVSDPYVRFVDSKGNVVFFCLGITPSSTGIIGHNFMGGYEFFFNQQAMSFSWAPSTCYTLNSSTVGSPQDAPNFVTRASIQNSSESLKAPLSISSLFITYLLIAFIGLL